VLQATLLTQDTPSLESKSFPQEKFNRAISKMRLSGVSPDATALRKILCLDFVNKSQEYLDFAKSPFRDPTVLRQREKPLSKF